jgi:3'-5' exoribonuclease
VARVERKITSTQKPYLALALSDKTGQIEARMWSVPEDLSVNTGQFVKVEAAPETYKDELQLKINRLRVLERHEYAIEDFLPVSKRDPQEMIEELRAWTVNSIRSESLSHLLGFVISENERDLLLAPAAKSKHQAWLGGLLEHILNLCELAIAIAPVYRLDLDILIAAAVLHDIGKLWELRYDDRIDITPGGRLYGHILMGAHHLAQYGHELEPATYHHLMHIIASHHGTPEWGAARVPATREAWAFHLIDMLDSKLAMVDAAIAEGVDEDGFTSYHRDLGTMIWKP